MRRRLSALRLACTGGKASGLRARTCPLGLQHVLATNSSPYLCHSKLSQRQFSTHSFVLDASVHGRAAFQSNNPGVPFNPTNLYTHLTDSNQIDEDPLQLQALAQLDGMYDALLNSRLPPKRSLYIYGPAGSGKSMVMDLFHFCLEQNRVRSRRQHFHEFLYEMHRKMHQLHLKQQSSIRFRRDDNIGKSTHEFIRQISTDMARDLDVLCFDELAITTIQDCTLLVPLFSQIFRTNICLVTTSNRHPDNLYEDGLNRHLYFPAFLKTLHENAALAFVKTTDYREREFLKEQSLDNIAKVFFSTHETAEADAFLEKLGLAEATLDLTIGYNRKMLINTCSEDRKAATFDARKLFSGPPYWGADDYNAICAQFHTVVLENLYVFEMADHNEAKRLTNFLDCAYEMHVRVVCVKMENVDAEVIFEKLLPLETLSLQEILGIKKQNEDGVMAVPANGSASLAQEGSGSELPLTAPSATPQIAQRLSPGDQDSTTSSMADLVQSIQELPVANSQQSCYFLSKDHKDWSVESAIVQTSGRKQTAGVSSSRGFARRRSDLVGKLESFLPKEADQSGRSKPLPENDSSTNFDDSSSEQHSVKGVFVAAVASLHEAGFAVKRAISRLHEMQTTKYLNAHRAKRLL